MMFCHQVSNSSLLFLGVTPVSLTMCHPDWIQVHATADAMASQSLAGLGGAAIFPDGSSTWFQFRISLADAQSLWPWLGDDMQKHIAAWELLAQFALSYCIATHLPCTRGPIACHQATDNSAADAASAKGLTMTPALAAVLTPYFQFMRRHQVYPHITHIPGRLNVLADELSRFKEPLSAAVDPTSQQSIPWIELLQSSGIETTQTGRKWPSHFDIHLREKGLLQSADWVLPSISFWGVLTPAGRWSSYLVLLELPASTGWPQHTPVFGLLTGVSLNGGLFRGLAVPTLDPLVLIHCCTDWTFSAPRLKQKAPAQQPCHTCLECHVHNLHEGKLKQRKL